MDNSLLCFSDDELMHEYSLKKLIRYNNMNRICDESVAEHSFFVTLFCIKICTRLKLTAEATNKVLTKAMLHDVPELYTSDIPHPVKIKSEQLRLALEELEHEMILNMFPEHYDLIFNADELTTLIVKLADEYSVKQFIFNELELGNNSANAYCILSDVNERCDALIKKIGDVINACE